jgi:hypothetical protein
MRPTTIVGDALAPPIATSHQSRYASDEASHPSTSFRDSGAAGRRKLGRSHWTSVRIVSLLAFAHSIAFLVIWLLICASAGAVEQPKAEFSADIRLSTYKPVKQRDPFGKTSNGIREVKSQSGSVLGLQLDGILYQAKNPTAIVNGQLVTLNKIVTLNTGNEEIVIKAIEISRERVLLEANGRKLELNLSTKNSSGPAQP